MGYKNGESNLEIRNFDLEIRNTLRRRLSRLTLRNLSSEANPEAGYRDE